MLYKKRFSLNPRRQKLQNTYRGGLLSSSSAKKQIIANFGITLYYADYANLPVNAQQSQQLHQLATTATRI